MLSRSNVSAFDKVTIFICTWIFSLFFCFFFFMFLRRWVSDFMKKSLRFVWLWLMLMLNKRIEVNANRLNSFNSFSEESSWCWIKAEAWRFFVLSFALFSTASLINEIVLNFTFVLTVSVCLIEDFEVFSIIFWKACFEVVSARNEFFSSLATELRSMYYNCESSSS